MNLTTNYLGLQLKHPIMPGASPLTNRLACIRELEDAGASAIVLASLFEEQVRLTQSERLKMEGRLAEADPLNEASAFFEGSDAYAFGPDEYLEHIYRAKVAVDIPIIASLNARTPTTWVDFARSVQQAGADAIELNLYFLPTDSDTTGHAIEERMLEIVRSVRENSSLPLAVKLSPFFSSLPHFIDRLAAAGVKSVVLFNRFYQPDINVRFREVAPKLELSDSSELLLRLRWLAILSGRVPVDLTVTGGVHTPNDVIKSVLAGADTVQVVSALLRYGPQHLRSLVNGLTSYLEEHRFRSLSELRGKLNLANTANPEAYERANYVHSLLFWDR
ncbi:MAG TPA: dihydroorotate dehydrogenase-like protein [Acidobacteriota bacterium]|nr:dihydroorotate dehydrogenase-like protein [Acidobacteriota bacterium]